MCRACGQAEQLEAELDAAYDALELELRAMPCADLQQVCAAFFHESSTCMQGCGRARSDLTWGCACAGVHGLEG